MTMTDHLAELSQVTLRSPVDTESGQLPIGAVGTVVRFDPQAQTYEIKFLQPFHAQITLETAAMTGHQVWTSIHTNSSVAIT
jgi:hypothetical protein